MAQPDPSTETAERFLEGTATEAEMTAAAKAAFIRAAGNWPNAVEAWAARAQAEAAGTQPTAAAKAAAEAVRWRTQDDVMWHETLRDQVAKLRLLLGAEGRAAVLANLRKIDQGQK